MRTSAAILAEIKAINAKDKSYNKFMNEGGEGYERETNTDALYAEYKTAQAAEFSAKWTKTFFENAKAAWNAEVKKNAGKPINGNLIAAMEKASGVKIADLKAAKEIHG